METLEEKLQFNEEEVLKNNIDLFKKLLKWMILRLSNINVMMN